MKEKTWETSNSHRLKIVVMTLTKHLATLIKWMHLLMVTTLSKLVSHGHPQLHSECVDRLGAWLSLCPVTMKLLFLEVFVTFRTQYRIGDNIVLLVENRIVYIH